VLHATVQVVRPVPGAQPRDVTFEPHLWFRVARGLLLRPGLWWTAMRQLLRLAAPGWWRRPPFVPRPEPEHLRFRLETAYGTGGDRCVRAPDLLAYLEWCRNRAA